MTSTFSRHHQPTRAPLTRRPCLLMLLALLGLGFTACTSVTNPGKPPRISIVSIRPVAISLLEQRYMITMRIQNPNSAPLAIEGLDYHLNINGKSFAEGVSNQHVTIDGYSEKALELGVRSTTAQMFEQLKSLAGSNGRLDYSIQGHLRLRGLSSEVPFEHHGGVDFRLSPEPKKYSAGLAPVSSTVI